MTGNEMHTYPIIAPLSQNRYVEFAYVILAERVNSEKAHVFEWVLQTRCMQHLEILIHTARAQQRRPLE